jgi:hypothetical protein
MSPTAKKLATDSLARAFDEAEAAPALSDEDRTALVEAAADPTWVRMSRGDAFERLVCDGNDE